MRVLLLNPNTTSAMTEQMLAVGQRVASEETTLVPLTAPTGVPYIASRAEAQLAGATVLEMLADHGAGADAAIIGAFGDPGLRAARDLFDFPVIGMAEAAMLSACLFGERFVIVTFSKTLHRWYEDCVALYRLERRCAGIVVPDQAFASVSNVQNEMRDALISTAIAAVAEGADVVILGGAPLAGLARHVACDIPAPVIDPAEAAVTFAEAAVRLEPQRMRRHRPPGKDSIGLPRRLADRIANR